jgi:predicted nucleic acid-binding protein
MHAALIDSNVLLDILLRDSQWYSWSSDRIAALVEERPIFINPIIYAELSVGFDSIEALDLALPRHVFRRAPLPWEAGFLAGKAFASYKRRGGARRSPLPDFYIGAHASAMKMTLVTRDAARYRTYFPKISLITPR